ncbi:apoptosis regulatory protein Siva isoform X1 [Carcharodon carcharias]|uniref:apoptosis regulatory protein Siva isoform X1 n=1 Tax=Carcharodon carcharias TaxID=13397 RepID=UPI001B7E38DD|nr:apoptosis regulatory protein Siva isoform X1 [Carcharodon carcharias]
MTKRASPFGDTAPLQWKIHVTQKELNEGVFGEKYKREVYEKTKNLLFNGAQAFMGYMWTGNSEENCTLVPMSKPIEGNCLKEPEDVCNGCEGRELLHGQTFLGHNGQLVKGSLSSNRSPIKPATTNCFICLKPSNFKEPCSQCDRLICQHCSKVCDHCARICCSLCSFDDYNEAYDQVFCYGCFP